jgi:hypothetical protein
MNHSFDPTKRASTSRVQPPRERRLLGEIDGYTLYRSLRADDFHWLATFWIVSKLQNTRGSKCDPSRALPDLSLPTALIHARSARAEVKAREKEAASVYGSELSQLLIPWW